MIADHAWLLDLSKIFKGKKYIIRVKPSSSEEGSNDPIIEEVSEAEKVMMKKVQKMQTNIQKRVDGIDLNTRFQLNYQQ